MISVVGSERIEPAFASSTHCWSGNQQKLLTYFFNIVFSVFVSMRMFIVEEPFVSRSIPDPTRPAARYVFRVRFPRCVNNMKVYTIMNVRHRQMTIPATETYCSDKSINTHDQRKMAGSLPRPCQNMDHRVFSTVCLLCLDLRPLFVFLFVFVCLLGLVLLMLFKASCSSYVLILV